MIKIKRGMDLPIQGAPQQTIEEAPPARAVALVGPDYVGMKPTMEVAEGDRVKAGQLLFTDKKTAGVRYTAPAGGIVSAINRGARRVLQSVVIDVEGDASQSFTAHSASEARALDAQAIREQLNEAGQWT
ncbi:MAG: NADH:ubiquinone reductase (Na(+)-transporting) subunit A, partial [Haliea sp.]|nr:NADH:ubiquinone reductase (Na(+)-transporting) subunit A [Haliea sp.]